MGERVKIWLGLLAAMSLFAASCASTVEADARFAAADQLLDRVLAEDRGAGVQAAVVKDGLLMWSGAAGFADAEQHINLTPESKLRIGSVSKPFAAALALRMATAGAFDINADIRRYLPEAPVRERPITAKLLATHSSGVRHFDFSNYLEANNVFYRKALAEGLESFLNDPLLSAPGEKVHYSSHGYDMLGAALERAGDSNYAALFDQYVAKSFELNATTVDHPFDIIEGRARFYTVTAEFEAFGWTRAGALVNTVIRDSSDYYPSGGMLSSAEDLASFAAKFFESDLIAGQYKNLASEPARLNDGRIATDADGADTVDITFGWRIWRNEDDTLAAYGHNGETNGAYALIRYFPKTRTAVAAVANYNVFGAEPAFFNAFGKQLPTIFDAE